ncbi:MAG: M28 family peptidase [Bacteroidota bacterium]
MRKLLKLLIVSSLFFTCGTSKKQSQQDTSNSTSTTETNANSPEVYANTITADELKDMLFTYASDDFEGRDTGEQGQKKAIEYLRQQYLDMGVAAPLEGGENYFQEVPLVKQKTAIANVVINGEEYKAFEDQIVIMINESIDMNTEDIVYVGYGIDSENYSDYKDIDVRGKVVLAKAGEPKDESGNYVTTGTTEKSKWTEGRQAISSKRDAALEKGAAVFIYAENSLFKRYAPYLERLARNGTNRNLSLVNNKESMLMIMSNSVLAEAIYPDIYDDDKSKKIESSIVIKAENQSEIIQSENVLAYIEGSEKPDELVVISAHLDHVGITDGEVYNGADDDGSGTVAVVEIAEAFKTAVLEGHTPKRSILFLHVTGEERGLLGSRYYTDIDPIFPLSNTVANLNIDMIGRTDPKRTEGNRNYVYLIGSDKLSTELHELSEEVNNKYCNVELDYKYNDENDPNRFYYRSDHYNFAKNNVPVIFYFNGTHADYHQPSDTPDKIEYDLLENRARLVFHTAWELANREKRITVDKAVE